jgi:hypothetical protein
VEIGKLRAGITSFGEDEAGELLFTVDQEGAGVPADAEVVRAGMQRSLVGILAITEPDDPGFRPVQPQENAPVACPQTPTVRAFQLLDVGCSRGAEIARRQSNSSRLPGVSCGELKDEFDS